MHTRCALQCMHAVVITSQAEAAYTRATGLDGSNLLAWQGLAELYAETGAQLHHMTAVFSWINMFISVWHACAVKTQ